MRTLKRELQNRIDELKKNANLIAIISNKRSYQETTSADENQENQYPNKRRNTHSEQDITVKSPNRVPYLLGKLFSERDKTGDVCCHLADGTQEMVHSFVLIESSSYFKEAIDRVRSLDSEKPIEFALTDIDPGSFLEIVEFLYTNNLFPNPEMNPTRVFSFLNDAERYSIPRLYRECIRFIHSSISLDNALTYLDVAVECNSHTAQSLILDLICLNARDFLITDSFCKIKSLKKESLIKILQDDRLSLDEDQVISLARNWLADKAVAYGEINEMEKEKGKEKESDETEVGGVVLPIQRTGEREGEKSENPIKESLSELIQSVSSHIRLSLLPHDTLFEYWMKQSVGNHPLFSEHAICQAALSDNRSNAPKRHRVIRDSNNHNDGSKKRVFMLDDSIKESLGVLIGEHLTTKAHSRSILDAIQDAYIHWYKDVLFFSYTCNPRGKIEREKMEGGIELILRIGLAGRGGFVFRTLLIPFECSTFSYSKIILRKDELDNIIGT